MKISELHRARCEVGFEGRHVAAGSCLNESCSGGLTRGEATQLLNVPIRMEPNIFGSQNIQVFCYPNRWSKTHEVHYFLRDRMNSYRRTRLSDTD